MSQGGAIVSGGGNLSNPVAVDEGGTGVASLDAYEPVIGGTTATGALQSVNLGSSGDLLTSNGTGAAPTFQTPSGGSSPWSGFGYISGQYYTGPLINPNGPANNHPLSADDLYALPFICTDTATFDRIGIAIQVAGAGGESLRLGIYNNANGKPSTVLLTAGTISTDGTGFGEVTISQELTPGPYWLVIQAEAAVSVITLFDGNYFLPTVSGNNYTAHGSLEFAGQTYASGLPDLTAVAVSTYQTHAPIIKLRA